MVESCCGAINVAMMKIIKEKKEAKRQKCSFSNVDRHQKGQREGLKLVFKYLLTKYSHRTILSYHVYITGCIGTDS